MKAELQVHSWRIRSILATHYYGYLYIPDEGQYEISRQLTDLEAWQFNECEKVNCLALGITYDELGAYKEGDWSQRFNSVDEIIGAIPVFIARENLNITEVWHDIEENIVWQRSEQTQG